MSRKSHALAETAAVLAYEAAAGFGPDTEAPSPYVVAQDAAALHRLAGRAHRVAVAYCNGWTDPDKAQAVRERVFILATDIARRYGATVTVGGDPRGYSLRLRLGSGHTNSIDGESYGIAA